MSAEHRPVHPVPPEGEHPPHHKHPRVSMAWKIFTISAGATLILMGLVMLVIPGPGLLAIFGGLAMLSPHSRWAHRITHWLREKLRLHRVGDGPPPG
jgi:uncharacterized protein (TIGR02611 family)